MTWFTNPLDRYWQVADTDPSTHRFSGISGTYVVLADADYVQFLADGGVVATIATDDEVKYERARIIYLLGDKQAKQPCRVITTTNITLSGEQTYDSVGLVSGNRAAVAGQTDPSDNGIYIVQAGSWLRAPDADSKEKLLGATVTITEGDNGNNTLWFIAFPPAGELGTDSIPFVYIGGRPLTLTSTTPALSDVLTFHRPLSASASSERQATFADAPFHHKAAVVQETGSTHTVASTTTDLICNRAGTVTVTLPSAASYVGRAITIQTWQAQAVESASSDVVAPGGGAAGTAILAATAGKWARLVSNGTYWYVISYN